MAASRTGQTERKRDPSHSDLETAIRRAGLSGGDPKSQGQVVGKAKRIKAVLSWAIEYNPAGGSELVSSLVSLVRGHGGFRLGSQNYVGPEAIENLAAAFAGEGYDLASDGELRPKVLDSFSGAQLTEALQAYVRRAKRGVADAALVTGTGKDLLEAVAAHILQQRFGSYPQTSNFPTLLGQAFIALQMSTSHDPVLPDEPAMKRIERAMFDLACGINRLRNREGTGHGRPWTATVTEAEAKLAVESMGIIAERMLGLHLERK